MATRSVSRASRAQSRPTTKKRASAKARKVKFIEVDGHQLTHELYRQYERHLESRRQTNRDMPQAIIEELALSDTIYKYRFSGSTKEKLAPIYQQLSAVASAAWALGMHYPFYESNARHVRLAGCDTLNRLAAEAQHLGAMVAAIGDAIRYEEREKLQDWQRRQAALEAASPYGLAPTVQS
jgi:hypothetical protein